MSVSRFFRNFKENPDLLLISLSVSVLLLIPDFWWILKTDKDELIFELWLLPLLFSRAPRDSNGFLFFAWTLKCSSKSSPAPEKSFWLTGLKFLMRSNTTTIRSKPCTKSYHPIRRVSLIIEISWPWSRVSNTATTFWIWRKKCRMQRWTTWDFSVIRWLTSTSCIKQLSWRRCTWK